MTRVSMGDVWDDAKAFVTREAALLWPLALATLGFAAVILNLAMPARGNLMTNAPSVLALVPVLLLLLLGQLAISLLVVESRASVGEALAGAVRRIPGALLASLATGVAMLALLLVAGILGQLIAMIVGGGQARAATAAMIVAAPGGLWLFVRLIALLPMLAAMPPTLRVIPPIRRAFALTRGRALTILGAVLAFFVAYALILAALEFAGGSLLIMAGRALGAPEAGVTVTLVLVSLIGAVLQTVWAVYQAMLFRRLEGAS